MLKQEKLAKILEIVNSKGTITVKQIMDEIAVSDMTARRYLQELADKDLLIRVHGGAEKLRTNSLLTNERSNIEKQADKIKLNIQQGESISRAKVLLEQTQALLEKLSNEKITLAAALDEENKKSFEIEKLTKDSATISAQLPEYDELSQKQTALAKNISLI